MAYQECVTCGTCEITPPMHKEESEFICRECLKRAVREKDEQLKQWMECIKAIEEMVGYRLNRENLPLALCASFALQHNEIEKLQKWVDDLQSGMYVNCVYCGHRYGPGETTPVSMADALKEHIKQCPKHPMSALRAKFTEIRQSLEALLAQLPDECDGHA